MYFYSLNQIFRTIVVFAVEGGEVVSSVAK